MESNNNFSDDFKVFEKPDAVLGIMALSPGSLC